MSLQFNLLAFVGRFEPFHNGHAGVVRYGLSLSDKVIVLVGSSRGSRSIRNPFNYKERVDLITLGLTPSEVERVIIAGIPDFHDNSAWAAYVEQIVRQYAAPAARIGYLGHRKDESSDYLNLFPAGLVEAPNFSGIDATDIRADFFGNNAELLPDYPMTPAARDALAKFSGTTAYTDLQEEWQDVIDFRAPYLGLPYEPAWLTGDAVVRVDGKILMIRRGKAPGKGQWALPGGFVERHELFLTAALRELSEETLICFDRTVLAGRTPKAYLQTCLKAEIGSDYPYRSVRGRVATRAFLFDMDQRPEVSPTAEARELGWFTPEEIIAMQESVFEDHALLVRKITQVAQL